MFGENFAYLGLEDSNRNSTLSEERLRDDFCGAGLAGTCLRFGFDSISEFSDLGVNLRYFVRGPVGLNSTLSAERFSSFLLVLRLWTGFGFGT